MSQTVFLRNVSGENFLIEEISKKPITANREKLWEIDRKIVENNNTVKKLINEKKFIIEGEENFSQSLDEKKFDEKNIKEKNSVDIHLQKKENNTIEENEKDIFSFGNVDIFEDKNKSLNTENKKTNISAPNLWWRGPANDMGGYGKMNRYCLKGLHKKNVHIELDMHNIPSIRNTIPLDQELEEMLNNRVDMKSPSVWAIMPPKFPTRQGRVIYFTMLESGAVHESFLNKLNNADEVWVPSEFNVNILKEENLNANIVQIPLGVDTDFYKPMDLTPTQRGRFDFQTKGFTFLSVFGWSLRKGNDVLLKSYLKTFTKYDNTTLLIVSRLNGSSAVENIKKIRNEISDYIRTFCPDSNDAPHIVHIGIGIPEKDMPILYNMCDCFVLPSRGEGWGLPYCEAGSCGLPVIATRCGGQLDFLNDENSYLIDIEGYGMERQEIKDISSYYEGVPFAVLGKTAIDQLCESMKEVYINSIKSKEKGKILMNHIKENFTWQHTVDKIYDRIK